MVATLAQPWLASHRGEENSWRFDPKVAGGGILADAGDHLIDALLWTLGRSAETAAAIQGRLESGLDLVTAAAIRLAGGTLATLALAGDSPSPLFELTYFGERGRLRATEDRLFLDPTGSRVKSPTSRLRSKPSTAISSRRSGASAPLCCPAEEALGTVRLLEAIARSAATGQVVRLGVLARPGESSRVAA